MSTYGFYRVAAAVPQLRVADVDYNVREIATCCHQAEQEQTAALVFPELSLTGYSCGDLFHQKALQQDALQGLKKLANLTEQSSVIIIVGLPLRVNDALYNVAAVLQSGQICGFVPKSVLPNYREFYERRQFTPASHLRQNYFQFDGKQIPLGTDLIFEDESKEFRFGIEICEDLWSIVPPSCSLVRGGALLIFNPSAGTELVGKAEYRRDLVRQQSARCLSGYIFASAGVHESTQDVVYGGHALIAENGRLTAENTRFDRKSNLIFADIDTDKLAAARLSESSFNALPLPKDVAYRHVRLAHTVSPDVPQYFANPAYPFLPNEKDKTARCEDILAIQSAGLAKRIEHTHAKKLVIGVSGGLDSTLALLVTARTCRMLGMESSSIMAVTMPGFGTTGRTYHNAVTLCKLLGTELREINIKESCLTHFRDIGHRPEERTTTYENVQARERTQILMDLANKHGGLVIGTGDLSEIALGWSTYNGDHMSMYSVNCSVPKTLIRCLIEHVAAKSSPEQAAVLSDINATPVSPELLPPTDDGSIEQKTEDILGPYDLHDFFLYHLIKYGASPDKILYLAKRAFEGKFSSEFIRKTLKTFLSRFFTQQFKRSCSPDGPKVGSIALSPRGDWRMPSDAMAATWLQKIEN